MRKKLLKTTLIGSVLLLLLLFIYSNERLLKYYPRLDLVNKAIDEINRLSGSILLTL